MSDNESNNTRAAKFVGDVALKAITAAQSALARDVLAEIDKSQPRGSADYYEAIMRDLFTRLGVKIGD